MLRQKSLGSSIMVSDFVDEVSRFVRDGSNLVCLLLETNKDGYFTNNHLLDQVKKIIDIFEDIHLSCRGIFMFDNAPSYKKVAVNLDKMNVHPGGKQPVMRDTTWQGRVQQMMYPDGTTKGRRSWRREG